MTHVTGLILSGGRGQRVGGQDKGLLRYRDRDLIDHVIERLRPQVSHLLISANRSRIEYLKKGFEVLEDDLPGFLGPMAGVASGLYRSVTDWVQITPCDGPALPLDLTWRLLQARKKTSRVMVPMTRDNCGTSHYHYTFMLVHSALASSAFDYLWAGRRRLRDWAEMQAPGFIAFENPNAFLNLNTPEDFHTHSP